MKIGTGLVLSLTLFTSVVLSDSTAPRPASPPPPTSAPSGWLGVSLGSDESDPAFGAAEAPPTGIKVLGVVHGGPAQRAGLRARDRILSVDGKSVATPKDVIGIVTSRPPGSEISMSVLRKGEERLLTASLESRPTEDSLRKMFDGWIGVEAIDLPPALRRHFGSPSEAGVMISSVKDDGPAQAAGLRVGDVVFEVDGEAVGSVGTLRKLIASGGADNRLEVRIMRDGAEIVVEPLVSARPEADDRD